MNTICSTKEFYKIIERERTRSDRTNREFAVIIFHKMNSKDNNYFIQYFTNVLSNRIRCYDDMGWLDKEQIGVILPETSAEGANKLASNVCKTITPGHLQPGYKIWTYPSDWGSLNIATQKGNNQLSCEDGTDAGKETVFKKELSLLFSVRTLLWKRAVDISVAFLGLILLFPLLLFIAAFIKIVSSGPVLFKQQRVGFMGEIFFCWKFRTMKVGAETKGHEKHLGNVIDSNIPMNKMDEWDLRIIPFGKILRKTGMDELPQLINVIFGQMSLIGPRPCIPYEAQQFLQWQHKRFDALPGLSGLWQVNGKNRTTFKEMMRYDISYAKNRSLSLDMDIFLKTLPAIIDQVIDKKEAVTEERVAGQTDFA
jgi:lipopolysaccharide/colanic/teichoic acid biosynthesis glycosyltransferase